MNGREKGIPHQSGIPYNFIWLGDVDSNHDSRSQSQKVVK